MRDFKQKKTLESLKIVASFKSWGGSRFKTFFGFGCSRAAFEDFEPLLFCSGKSHSFEMTISSKRACCVFESVFMSPVICHNVDQVRLGWF